MLEATLSREPRQNAMMKLALGVAHIFGIVLASGNLLEIGQPARLFVEKLFITGLPFAQISRSWATAEKMPAWGIQVILASAMIMERIAFK